MMKKLSFFLLCASSLSGAQYCLMDSTEVISVHLSSTNHNRIGIVGDRIKKAFFKGCNISVDVEDNSGQIFIQSLRHDCPNTTLSIVSCAGLLQDLDLQFSDQPSEIVLLQPSSLEEWPQEECTTADTSDLTSIVEGFLKGDIPEGYTSYEDSDAPITIKKCLKLQRFSRMVSDKQIVFAFRLHNESSEKQSIRECQVNVLEGDWVFVDRYVLRPNECALVLIGCYR
jgi:hypothetical protein